MMRPSSPSLANIIRWGLLVLVAVMPFHAFLSVWLGHLIGHQAIIQAWKELWLAGLSIAGAVYYIRTPARRGLLRQPWLMAAVVFAICALLAAVTGLLSHRITAAMALFGAKIDLEFLAAAALASLVTSPGFVKRAVLAAAVSSGVVVTFVLAQIYLLPADFLVRFGYGADTVRPFLYLTGAPGVVRYIGTLGGPNQLGAFLILPLGLSLAAVKTRRPWLTLASIPVGIALFHTYSRSAWLGAGITTMVMLLWLTPRRARVWLAGALSIIATIAVLSAPQIIATHPGLQERLLHSTLQAHEQAGTSDVEHAASLSAGWQAVRQAPLGYGLGSAGPATFKSSLPSNIIENQYLQYAYETGWVGGLAAIMLFALLIVRVGRSALQPWNIAVAAALAGVSVAGFVIPTWDDSTIALVAFTLAGALAGLATTTFHHQGRQHVPATDV